MQSYTLDKIIVHRRLPPWFSHEVRGSVTDVGRSSQISRPLFEMHCPRGFGEPRSLTGSHFWYRVLWSNVVAAIATVQAAGGRLGLRHRGIQGELPVGFEFPIDRGN